MSEKPTKLESVVSGCLGLMIVGAITPFIVIPHALLDGWVLQKLWGWFIVPVFGLPALSLAAAIGIGMTASYITHHSQVRPKETQEGKAAVASMLWELFFRPLVALGLGWVIQRFM